MRFVLLPVLFLLVLSPLPAKAAWSLENLLNGSSMQVKSFASLEQQEEEEKSNKGNTVDKFFEDFDNFKFLVAFMVPGALFMASISSLEDLAKRQQDALNRRMRALELERERLDEELKSINERLEEYEGRINELRCVLSEGGRIVEDKEMVEKILEERRGLRKEILEIEKAMDLKFV